MSNTKCRIKLVANLLVASVVLVGFSGSRCLASLAGVLEDWSSWTDSKITGELTVNATVVNGATINSQGLIADGDWNNEGTKLSWSVEAIYDGDSSPDYFHYMYTFSETATGVEVSHINFEVSDAVIDGLPAFVTGYPDYFNASQEPDEQGELKTGPGNPGMPHPLWGLKYETGLSDGTWTLEFDSMRVPEWGDFYAKDGANAQYVYNSGFDHDPLIGTNLDDFGYIARPDTAYVPIPPAILLGVLGLGVAGVKLRKFA